MRNTIASLLFFFSSSRIHPTQNNDTLQIPIGNSTGSLPDLTLVHYQQSPLSNPLDLENEHIIAVTNGTFNSVRLFFRRVAWLHFHGHSHVFSPSQNTFSSPMEISTNFGQQQMFQQIGHNQQNSTLEDFNGKHFNNNNNSNSNNLNSNKVSTSSQVNVNSLDLYSHFSCVPLTNRVSNKEAIKLHMHNNRVQYL